MLRIHGQAVSAVGVGEPRKLHDRTPSRVEDGPLDVLGVAFDPVVVSGHEDDLRRAGRGLPSVVALAHRVQVWRVGALGGQWRRNPRREASSGDRSAAEAIVSQAGRESRFASGGVGATVAMRAFLAREVLLADAANLSD
jgi:hypothetical protein